MKIKENQIVTAFSAFGMSGRVFHGPLLMAHPGFSWNGVVQRSKSDALELNPEVQIFKSLEDCLNVLRPELVVINTPPHLHEREATMALEAGCHVLVEKPFVTSMNQAKNLISLAEKKGKILTTFQNRRWDSDFLTVKKLLASGRLGKISQLEIYFDRYRPKVEAGTWKEEDNPGSGLVWNLGPHLLDQAMVLFGFPNGLTAFLRKNRAGAQVEDCFHIVLHYPDKEVELKSSYLVPHHLPKYKIQGEYYSFEKSGMDIQEQQLKAGIKPNSEGFGKEPESQKGWLIRINGQDIEKESVENEIGNYPAFYNKLFAAIRNQEEPPVSIKDLETLMRLLLAVYQSDKERRAIWF
jgi:scyllo-inositol 2-dehydrogenase (NADP+)